MKEVLKLASDPNFYELCELLVFSTLSIDHGRNLKLVASAFEKATIYDIFAIFAVGKLSINYSLNHILRN